MQSHFSMFAAYNRWANDQLYRAAGTLTEEEYNRDTGAFFRSLNGTLNHLIVADRIWMKRFTGDGEHPDRLDAMPYPRLGDLTVARHSEDRRIIRYIDALPAEKLLGRISYATTDGTEITQHLGPALSHFFNHQTHHRGQAHTILSMLGKQPPSLDLLYFQRSEDGRQYS